MSCEAPLRFETLVDYWSHALTASEEADVEEHQFSCEQCARRLGAVGEIGRGLATVAQRRGGIALPVTASLVAQLERTGLVMRHYRGRPGDVIPCTVGADDDLLVTWLDADFAGVTRVDVAVYDSASGHLHDRNEDVPMDRVKNQVIYTIAGDVARTWSARLLHIRLLAVGPDGERVLGDYHFHHTPYQRA